MALQSLLFFSLEPGLFLEHVAQAYNLAATSKCRNFLHCVIWMGIQEYTQGFMGSKPAELWASESTPRELWSLKSMPRDLQALKSTPKVLWASKSTPNKGCKVGGRITTFVSKS